MTRRTSSEKTQQPPPKERGLFLESTVSLLDLDRGADEAEGLVGVRAEGRDGGDADHDDEGQHNGVLNRGRAIFLLQERNQALGQTAHGNSRVCVGVIRK